jgi:cytochrome P450
MQSLSERHQYYRDLEPDDAPARLSLGQLRADVLGTQKLLVPEHDGSAYLGADWQRQRKLAQPVFDKALMARVVEIAGVLTTQLLASWDRARERGEEVDVLDDMQDLAMRVIGMALFSRDIRSAVREAADGTATTTANCFTEAVRSGAPVVFQRNISPVPLPLWLPSRRNQRFRRARAAVDRFVYERIDERLAGGGDYDDILGELIRAHGDDATRIRRDLRDQVVTLFFAGFETTAVALAWTWLLLSQNPAAEARFHAELDTVLGGRAPVPQDLKALAYTSLVIQESLRIYPPFAVGQRRCLGATFATVEMLTVLAVAGQRVRLRRTAEGPVTAAPAVTQRPAAGLRMRVAARP